MKTIGIISQKGGAGKTTLAIHLSVHASQSGLKVIVFDLDPQASISSWSDKRDSQDITVVSLQASRLEASIKQARQQGFDLVIIDSAPNADSASMEAARVADLILIPCRPSALDLHAIRTTLSFTTVVGKPAYVILNAIPPHSKIGQEAFEALKAAQVNVIDIMIHQLIGFCHCLNDGLSAQEISPKSKAAQETRALYSWIINYLGVQQYSSTAVQQYCNNNS